MKLFISYLGAELGYEVTDITRTTGGQDHNLADEQKYMSLLEQVTQRRLRKWPDLLMCDLFFSKQKVLPFAVIYFYVVLSFLKYSLNYSASSSYIFLLRYESYSEVFYII